MEQRDAADSGAYPGASLVRRSLQALQDIPDAVAAAKKKGKPTFGPLGPKL